MVELRAIFYARFHPERGPSVIVQVPEEGVVATRTSTSEGERDEKDTEGIKKRAKSEVNFSDISSYIIPPYDLCGKSLSVRVGNGYRVLGWPVSLESETYARNRFTFDVCFVLGEGTSELEAEDGVAGAGVRSWEQIVKKTALFFQALELEDGILSAEEERMESGAGGNVAKNLLEKIFEQMTTYGEACVRVDKIHTLNLRLPSSQTAARQVPSKINAWDVPVLIRALPSPEEWTYDLVLARIHPHMNGINHVAKIAELAEADIKFVKRAIKGLVALGRVRILDLFHFQAMYALTKEFEWFVRDAEMREECRRYVIVPSANGKVRDAGNDNRAVEATPAKASSTQHLLTLYNALATSQSVHDFVLSPQSHLRGIDIRRFVTFGVLKGFLRRKHKYVLAIAHSSMPQGKGSSSSGAKFGSGSGGKRSGEDASREFDRAWRKAALSSGWATPPFEVSGSLGSQEQRVSPEKTVSSSSGGRGEGADRGISAEEEKLKEFLDGTHCLDEICLAMRMGERKVLERLRAGRRAFGEVVVFCK